MNKKHLKSILLILIIFLISCAARTRISAIKQAPRRYHDRVVTVSGVVKNTITLPVLNVGLFQIDDGTGKIWVKPREKTPFKGQRVSVTGKIKVGLTISGRSFGVILIESQEDKYY